MKRFSLLLSLALVVMVQTASARLGWKCAVWSMAQDAGKVYLGTTRGLIVYDKDSGLQSILTAGVGAPFHGEAVYSLCLHDGRLLAGQDDGWVAVMDADGQWTESFQVRSHEGFGYLYPPMHNLAMGTDGVLYSAGWLECDLWLSRGDEVLDRIAIPYGFMEQTVEDMKMGPDGALWLVTSGLCPDSYLCRYTPAGGLELLLGEYNHQVGANYSSQCLAFDAGGHVWVAVMSGWLYEYADGSITLYDMPQSGRGRLVDMAFDADGVLWIVSEDGQLISFDGTSFTQRQLEMADGDRAGRMLIDGSTIYVGTDQHLIVVDGEEQTSLPLIAHPSDDGIVTGISDARHSSAAPVITDLQGRRLHSAPAHGLYIQDGRKRVVR